MENNDCMIFAARWFLSFLIFNLKEMLNYYGGAV